MEPMVSEAKAARACARSCTCPFLGHVFRVTGVMAYVARHWKAVAAVLYHIDPFEGSWIQPRRYLGGSPSCLVTLMVLDFGRVIYLT